MTAPAAVVEIWAGERHGSRRTARKRLPSGWTAGLTAVLLAAVALRIAPDLYPGNLMGVLEYDDGVHYTAGLALLHGQLPYRDFVLLHPPGIALLMAPVAALGELIGEPAAMALARLGIIAVGLMNAALLARLLRRASPLAGLAGAAVYAAYPGAIYAERTVLLEPLLNLACILAVGALIRGRDNRAGWLLGAAVCIKLFALVYPAAAILWLCSRREPRRARRLVASAAFAVATFAAPFALLAPGRFWHDVVTVQLRRPLAGATSPVERLSDLLGLSSMLGHPGSSAVVATASVGLLLALFLLTARREDARIWILTAAGIVAAFLAASSYFPHYAGFLAPALAALTGLALEEVRLHHPRLLTAATLGSVLALTAAAAGTLRELHSQSDLAAAVAQYMQAAGCGFSDSPSLLVAADRSRPPSTSCPSWIDPRGTAISLLHSRRDPHFYPAGFRRIDAWQRQCRLAIGHADFILVAGSLAADPMFAADVRAYVETSFKRVAGRGSLTWELWVRSAPAEVPGALGGARVQPLPQRRGPTTGAG
ncbi:MAG: glycosyltransferase 87 family protein [Mycobacteriales bacterium]